MKQIKQNPGGTRLKYLMAFLLAATLLAVAAAFAVTGTFAREEIHIDVDAYGNVSVTPAEMAYYIERDEYGNILLLLPPGMEMEDVSVSTPYGWGYWLFDDEETQEAYEAHVAEARSRNGIVASGTYINDEETPETSPVAVLITSAMGGELGYMGIMPFSGRMVLFDPNHSGLLPEVHFTTTTGGAIGVANMPAPPTRDGFVFMAWTRTQDGLVVPPFTADAVVATGIQFTGTSTITAAQSPFTVYAQWGHSVSFYGNGADPPLAVGTGATGYSPRLVSPGMSVAETNATFFWTSPLWPNNPTRPAHRFMGWYTRDASTGAFLQRFDGNSLITENVLLVARWETALLAPPVEIIFDPQDGVTAPANFERRYTTTPAGAIGAPTFPADPTHPSGYRFLGWTRTQDASGLDTGLAIGVRITNASTFDVSIATTHTVYAQWGHQVTFNGNGVALAAGVTATGYGPRYAFDGMSVAATNPRALATLTQVWPNNPTRTDYAFLGWFDVPAQTGGNRFDANTPITEDVELFARWERRTIIFNINDGVTNPDDFFRYTIPTGASITAAIWSTIPEMHSPTHPNGYHFINWTRTPDGVATPPFLNTGDNASGTLFTGASTITLLQSPATVYAQWGHWVTFDLNGSVQAVGDNPNNAAHFVPRVVSSGRHFAESTPLVWTPTQVWPNNPVLAGHIFMGWFTRDASDNYVDRFDATTPITEATALYARWLPIDGTNLPVVLFDPNHSALPTHSVTTNANGNGTILAATWTAEVVPLQSGNPGYHFMGWTRTQDGLAAPPWLNSSDTRSGVGFISTSAVLPEHSPHTVWAQWGYQVSFDGNGMTLPNSGATQFNNAGHYGPRRVFPGMTFVQSNAITGINGTGGWLHQIWPTTAPLRDGYRFIGWNTQDDGEGDWYNQFTEIHGNRILFAQWIEEPWRVFFDLNDGFSPLPDSDLWAPLDEGAAAGPRYIGAANWATHVEPIDPFRPGHVFMQWTRTPEGYGAGADATLATAERFRAESTITFVQAPYTVYAQWGHTVTFTCDYYGLGSSHSNPGTAPRIISAGRSHTNSVALTWTIGVHNLAWPPNPTLSYHNFAGWWTRDPSGEYLERFDQNTPITEDLDLFTRWERRRVIFHPNDEGATSPPFPYALIDSNLTTGVAVPAVRWPADPVRSGYHFMGYTRTQDGSGWPVGTVAELLATGIRFHQTSTHTMAQSPLTVYAQWGHAVIFIGNGIGLPEGDNQGNPGHYLPRLVLPGLSVMETQNNYSWTNLVWPNNPSRSGFNFVGWYTVDDQGDLGQEFTATTPITEDTVLFAIWEPLSVTFDPQNGVTDPLNFEVRYVNLAGVVGDDMPPDPIHPGGYRFVAWTRTPTGLGPQQWNMHFTGESIVFTHEDPLTVFAQWGHQVTFACDETTLNIPADPDPTDPTHYGPRLVIDGHSVESQNSTFPWNNTVWPNDPPVRGGYVFRGWWTKNANDEFDQQVFADTVLDGDVDLFARWERRAVIFDLNYPSAGILTTENALENNTVGANFPAPPTRLGYHFMGWTRTQDGIPVPPMTNNTAVATGVGFLAASTVSPAETPLTVYAQWAYQVIFDGNGFSLVQGTAVTQYGPRLSRPGLSIIATNNTYGWTTQHWPNNPTRANHIFVEWNTESDGSGQPFDGDTPVTENVTIYAIWALPEVIFQHNDSSGVSETLQTGTNGQIGVANMPNPLRLGYTLLGWNRESDGTDANFLGTTVVAIADSPLTVYAQWGHAVTFSDQGTQTASIGVLTSRSAAETDALAWISAPWPANPVNPGFTFMGWYTMSGGSYITRFDANDIITADTELHARWGPEIPLTVHFRRNDSTPTIHDTVTMQPDGSVGVGDWPSNPVWGDRHFMGWTRNPGGVGIATGTADGVLFTETSTITGAQLPYDVYAQWGHWVTFNGAGVALTGADPNNPAHYAPRLVRADMTFDASNSLVWTPAQVWPNDPVNPSNNHRFGGWWIRDGSGNDIAQVTADTPITGNVELFARWYLRQVFFDPNGGTSALGHTQRTVQASGAGIHTVGNANMPQYPDHVRWFMEWTRSPDPLYPGERFTGTTVVTLSEAPLTVYAQWGNQVTFLCPAGSQNFTPIIFADGFTPAQSYNLTWTNHPEWPVPTRSGFNFLRWETAGGAIFDENTFITADVTLFAIWEVRDTRMVTFNMDDPGAEFAPKAADGASGRVPTNTRLAYYGTSVANSSVAQFHPTDITRLNQNVLGPSGAPLVRREYDGREMWAESWWTESGGPEGTGEFWVRQGWRTGHSGISTHNTISFSPTGTSMWHIGPGDALRQPIYDDIEVYPNWTFRVNFHPNGGSFRDDVLGWVHGFWPPGTGNLDLNANPHEFYSGHMRLFRDIPAVGPAYAGGTINEHGFVRRFRDPANNLAICNQAVPMGMPPWDIVSPPLRMIFVGWWDEQIHWSVPLGGEAAAGHPNATQWVGTEWVDSNMTLFARFIREPDPPPIPVTFHLNALDAYWWARPNMIGAWVQEIHQDPIVRHALYGYTLGTHEDMPILPLRDGYVFMGWWDDPTGPPPGFNMNPQPMTMANSFHQPPRFHANLVITEPREVFAHWEPAHLVIADPNGGIILGTPHFPAGDPGAVGYRLVAEGRTFYQMHAIYRSDRNNSHNALRSISVLPPPVLQCLTAIPLGMPFALPGREHYTISWYDTRGGTMTGTAACGVALGNRMDHRIHASIQAGNPRWQQFNILGGSNPALGNQTNRTTTSVVWNTAADASGTLFNNSTPVYGPMTIFAQWEVTLTFNTNFSPGQSLVPVTPNVWRTVPEGFSAATRHLHPNVTAPTSFPRPDILAPPGSFARNLALYGQLAELAFVGWNTEPDGSGFWINDSTIMEAPHITGHETLYAIWASEVVFMPNGAPPSSGIPAEGLRRLAVPGLNLNLAEDPLDSNIVGLPQFSQPGWNPNWATGVTFEGWRIHPTDEAAPTIPPADTGAGISSTPARTFYAVWSAPVLFNPTGGIMHIGGAPHITTEGVAGRVGSFFPASEWPHNFIRNNGAGVDVWHFAKWNDERWGLWEDTGNDFTLLTPIQRSWYLYAQWEAHVTFDLQGGHMSGNPANVIVPVPEAPPIYNGNPHFTMVNDPHRQGAPQQLMPPDPARPGFEFIDWFPAPILGNTPFTGSTHLSGSTTVFARWRALTTDFGFYKTDDRIYDDPPGFFTRNGAVFRLYQEIDPLAPLFEDRWEFVAERTSATHVTQGHGWVDFDGEITYIGRYALVEAQAPSGYRTPTGYWVIDWIRSGPGIDPLNHNTWQMTITPAGTPLNPSFRWLERVAASGEYDWYVGNELVIRFAFHKASERMYSMNAPIDWAYINDNFLLPDAEFSLFRWDSRTTSPPTPPDMAGMVTQGNSGPGGVWAYVGSGTSSGDVDDPIEFELNWR